MKNHFHTMYNSIIQSNFKKIDKITHRKTNTKMNLVKTYAIIAVVCSHYSGGGIVFPLSNWISPFFYFMPLFVFSSGYFYNSKYDSTTFISFLKNKIISLVIPYFIWNIFYGLLSTLLRKLQIINYGDNINFSSLFIRPWIDGHQFHLNIPSWFMLSLFIDVIIVYLFRKLMKKLHILNDSILLIFLFVLSIISIIIAQKGYNHDFFLCITKAGFMLPYFQLGYFYKKHELALTKHKATIIGIMFILLYICLVLSSKAGLTVQVVFSNFTGNPFLITATTTLSILITVTICDILTPSFENSKILNAIGNNTFSIMMHHGLIIFSINFFIYILTFFFDVSSFNITKFKSTLWYAYPWRDSRIFMFYVILGIAIPVLCKLLYNKIIIRLYNKL